MAGEFIEFFEELLFGSGVIFGFLIINLMLIGLIIRVKYATILTLPLSALMIVSYLTNLSVSSNFMWLSFLMFFSAILQLTIEVKR